MEGPILKIDGKRYTMGRLKAGTYRQIVLLGEDWPNYSNIELIEDCRIVVRDAFGLTQEQSDKIEMEQVMPIYRKIKELAENVFVERSVDIPNGEGPAENNEPGQS